MLMTRENQAVTAELASMMSERDRARQRIQVGVLSRQPKKLVVLRACVCLSVCLCVFASSFASEFFLLV